MKDEYLIMNNMKKEKSHVSVTFLSWHPLRESNPHLILRSLPQEVLFCSLFVTLKTSQALILLGLAGVTVLTESLSVFSDIMPFC